MTPAIPARALPSALLPVVIAVLLSACTTEIRDDMPGRAQSPSGAPALSGPIRTQTYTPGVSGAPSGAPSGERRLWSETQNRPTQQGTTRDRVAQDQPAQTARPPGDPQTPPPRRRGSSSPPPEPSVLPPRPIAPPGPPSTLDSTDAFKRDLIRPEVDRMRTDDAMGKLDPLQQRDLMRRENDLRQLGGDPLRR